MLFLSVLLVAFALSGSTNHHYNSKILASGYYYIPLNIISYCTDKIGFTNCCKFNNIDLKELSKFWIQLLLFQCYFVGTQKVLKLDLYLPVCDSL